MQLELLTERHKKYIERVLGMSSEKFIELCNRDDGDEEFDALLDELTWKECDAAEELEKNGEYSDDGKCAIELVDIICGPYDSIEDSDVEGESSEEDSADETPDDGIGLLRDFILSKRKDQGN